MKDWETIFTEWSKGPDDAEKARIENTEYQIKEAIRESSKLNHRNIKVFTQGSYRNNVNVKQDSDIDIGVLCYDVFFPEYPDDNVRKSFSALHEDAHYTYSVFKNEIEEALVARFGRENVKRGKKAFDIKENSRRVSADVVAFFEHRRYTSQNHYLSGVEMIPDNNSPPIIRNWPEQHYENGVRKNTQTSRRYKRVVRILKKLSYEMAENGIEAAKNTPSFLIECLIWNVANENILQDSYYNNLRNSLVFIFNKISEDKECNEWGEVSELKYLFRGSQPWTKKSVNDFILQAWSYVGYK